nr:lantibiotic dehydratase [Streptomonospora nanhaiensis]
MRASAIVGPGEVPSWPEAPADAPGHAEEWLTWLRHVRAHPVLGPAIAQASPDLARRLATICRKGGSRRDLSRVAAACARYMLRAQSRATPFGLFAGVAATAFTSAVKGGIGNDHRPVLRVSAPWIAGAVERLETCEQDFAAGLPVVANTLAAIRGGRMVVEHQGEPGADRAASSSLRLTTALRIALEAARIPAPRAQVETAVAAAFPDRRDDARRAVETLVRHRVLLSSLHPPLDTPDPLRHIHTAARSADAGRFPQVAALVDHLEAAHQAVRDHDGAATPAGRGAAARRAHRALAAVAPREAATTVDLRLDSDLTVPRTVAWRTQEATAILARLTPDPAGSPAWRDYHRRFCERYGMEAVVPIAELTDPDHGLGLPAGFAGSRLPPVPAGGLSERDTVLLDLAQRGIDAGGDLALDEAVLHRLGATPPEAVWPHTEVRVRIHARSRAALNTGDFSLVVTGVARAAGTTVGRFLDLLPRAGRDDLVNLYRRLPTLRRNAKPVQLTCPAASARGDQIARTPPVLTTRVALGQHHEAAPVQLSPADLAVTADARHLHLVTRRDLRPVEPVVFSAIEFTRTAHPMMRFLAELPRALAAVPAPFSWGAAAHLPFLPRVRWGSCVLAPARWWLASADLPGPGAPWRQWAEFLDRWRATHRVPARVYLGDHDRHLGLDLDLAAHQGLVRTAVQRDGRVLLHEAPTDQDLAWIGGRAHEIVTTLVADQAPIPVRLRLGAEPAAEHLPGGPGWCTVKLYGHPDRADGLITEELARLAAAGATRMWFLRYRDPDPHLRVRVWTEHPDQLAAVHDWTRALRRRGRVAAVVHDSYTPETGRFGPGPALTAAEELFVADSRAVAAALTATAGRDRRVWAAAGMYALVHQIFDEEARARSWLLDHVPRGAADRAQLDQAMPLTGSAPVGVPAPVADAWHERAAAARTYARTLHSIGGDPGEVLPDLLHLHAARFFGPDIDEERACLALARAAALSRHARRAPDGPVS